MTGTVVREVLAAGGRVSGVRLTDGSVLDADVVLIAIGSLPNVEWLAGSGIAVGNGVLCDRNCQARPGVWAAGDVASWVHGTTGRRVRLEHRTNAAEQGIAVAENILSGLSPTPFAPVPYIWSDQYDLKIQIYGTPRGADSFIIAEGDLEARKVVAYYGRDGVACAAVGINMARPLRAARAPSPRQPRGQLWTTSKEHGHEHAVWYIGPCWGVSGLGMIGGGVAASLVGRLRIPAVYDREHAGRRRAPAARSRAVRLGEVHAPRRGSSRLPSRSAHAGHPSRALVDGARAPATAIRALVPTARA